MSPKWLNLISRLGYDCGLWQPDGVHSRVLVSVRGRGNEDQPACTIASYTHYWCAQNTKGMLLVLFLKWKPWDYWYINNWQDVMFKKNKNKCQMRNNLVFILWCQIEITNLAKISCTHMSCPSYQKPYFIQENLTFCPCLTLFIERANCLTNVPSFTGDKVSTSHRMHQGRKHVPSQRSTEARPSTSGSWWVFLTCEKICFVALLQYSSPLQQEFCTYRYGVLYLRCH